MQQQTERVHVGRSRDVLAADLLRTRVLRRHHGESRLRVLSVIAIGRNQTCDAEVEQLHRSVRSHEDVRGLQVAMHDEVLMCVVYRTTNDLEETETLLDRESFPVAVLRDRQPPYVLHHEVRHACVADPAIHQTGNAGMLEAREDLPFGPEPLEQIGRHEARTHQLDRNRLHVLSIGALGAIDHAHPAPTDQLDQAIVSDGRAGSRLEQAERLRAGIVPDQARLYRERTLI